MAALAAIALVLTIHVEGKPALLPFAHGCPNGAYVTRIRPRGSSRVCVRTIRKTVAPGLDPKTIVQGVIETDTLPGGTIVSRQTQTFRFSRKTQRSRVTFRGRILRATGRYAGKGGTVAGTGVQTEARQDVTLTFQLR